MVTHRLRASGLLWRGIGLVLVVAAAFLAVPVQPASAATATSVSAGNNYTCALTAPGGVKCWGDNFEGSLGDGTTTNRSAPVDVVGLTSGVGDISTRWFHACAVTTSGGLKCWGFNAYGQIGNGTTTDSATPLDVTGLTSGVSAVAIGFGHTCAVTTAGGLKCWGRNDWGQLGDGTFTPRLTPADVSGLTSGVVGVIAGFAHTCALTTAGGLKCWGRNIDGQIGDGTTVTRPTAVDVTGLTSGVAGVATGNAHTCALTTIGGLKCWGSNNRGQLGDGTTVMRTTPVNVTGLTSGVATVSALFEHTCALTSVGGVKCWGRNSHGQIGDGTFANRLRPVVELALCSRESYPRPEEGRRGQNGCGRGGTGQPR